MKVCIGSMILIVSINTFCFFFVQILILLCIVQIVRISGFPSYVISSYSNVRIQQPNIGLSVESQMPLEMLFNPILADEPPQMTDKMESIFMKSDQIKNVESMNIDAKEIMESINQQTAKTNNDDDLFIAMGNEKPAGFSLPQ